MNSSEVINSFLTKNLVDEAVIYIAPMALGDNGKAPISEAMNKLYKCLNKIYEKRQIEDDIRLSGFIDETEGK